MGTQLRRVEYLNSIVKCHVLTVTETNKQLGTQKSMVSAFHPTLNKSNHSTGTSDIRIGSKDSSGMCVTRDEGN